VGTNFTGSSSTIPDQSEGDERRGVWRNSGGTGINTDLPGIDRVLGTATIRPAVTDATAGLDIRVAGQGSVGDWANVFTPVEIADDENLAGHG
jgi:hypothetical protein